MTFVNHPHSCTLFAWYIFQIIIPPFQKLYHMTDTKNYKHTYLLRNISNRIWIICTINYCTYPINTSWLTSEWLNFTATFSSSLQWRHNEHDGVSNHQRLDCLLSRLFRRKWEKTSKFRVTGLCVGHSPVTGEFPTQRPSNTENVSIWWRHHVI